MAKTIMILGAAEGQLNLVKICKKRGYRVICVSIAGNYPCFALADQSYYVDTRAKEEILKLAQSQKIDAITTDQTDVSVPSVAYVAEKLGLKGIGVDKALIFTNKYAMRQKAKAKGLAVPDFGKAQTLKEAQDLAARIGYPLIIKPVDSSGSRGVFKINNAEELAFNFATAQAKSLQGMVIIEEFIRGKEYLADGFAMAHKYQTLDVGDKEYFALQNRFVSKMCMFSSVNNLEDEQAKLVRKTNDALLQAFDLPFGITHAEYILRDEDKQVYLVECAARGGGVYLSSDLTPLACGFDTNTALLDYLLEDKVTMPREEELDHKVAAWLAFAFPTGVLTSFGGIEEVTKLQGVHRFISTNFKLGLKTEAPKDDSGKYGPILLFGPNRAFCYELISKIKQTFWATIQTAEGPKGLIW
ncbi:MAG: ATP-grasp domain-containing protein [Desulfovibrio sp.]|nr:ATP-grasp domain-containing protein [Desulfovibrio sp.]